MKGWVSDFSKALHADLELDDDGIFSFQVGQDVVITLEVSSEYPVVHLYSSLIAFPEDDPDTGLYLMTRALDLNSFLELTRRGAIAAPPGGDGLILCFNIPIYTQTSWRIGLWLRRVYLRIFVLTRALPLRQWSLVPDKNS